MTGENLQQILDLTLQFPQPSFALPPLLKFYILSCKERPVRSLLPFGQDDVGLCLNPYSSDYRTTFAFSDILYPHIHQLSLRLACPCGRIYGLIVFHVSNIRRLGGSSFPVCLCFRLPKSKGQDRILTILVTAYQHFWQFADYGIYHYFTYVHHTSKPSSLPRYARSSASTSRLRLRPFGVGYIVRGASDPAVTGHACPPRLLLGKQQVYLTILC